MGCRYLNVCTNSANDASISCKNFVNFGPVTPEKTGLILYTFYDMAKKLANLVKYLRIYWTDFYNLFTIWKHFECVWQNYTLYSDLSRDVAMAINWFWKNVMNADWYHLHSLHYRSKMSCTVYMCSLTVEMMWLYCVKIWWTSAR